MIGSPADSSDPFHEPPQCAQHLHNQNKHHTAAYSSSTSLLPHWPDYEAREQNGISLQWGDSTEQSCITSSDNSTHVADAASIWDPVLGKFSAPCYSTWDPKTLKNSKDTDDTESSPCRHHQVSLAHMRATSVYDSLASLRTTPCQLLEYKDQEGTSTTGSTTGEDVSEVSNHWHPLQNSLPSSSKLAVNSTISPRTSTVRSRDHRNKSLGLVPNTDRSQYLRRESQHTGYLFSGNLPSSTLFGNAIVSSSDAVGDGCSGSSESYADQLYQNMNLSILDKLTEDTMHPLCSSREPSRGYSTLENRHSRPMSNRVLPDSDLPSRPHQLITRARCVRWKDAHSSLHGIDVLGDILDDYLADLGGSIADQFDKIKQEAAKKHSKLSARDKEKAVARKIFKARADWNKSAKLSEFLQSTRDLK